MAGQTRLRVMPACAARVTGWASDAPPWVGQ